MKDPKFLTFSIGQHGTTRMTTTESHIASQYGSPLIPLEAVAEILGRKPNSLRILINQGRGDEQLATKLRACRAHLGRRVMFRVTDIARMIDEA